MQPMQLIAAVLVWFISSLNIAFSATPPVSASAKLIATAETGWPQFRGPRRDGICDETNLLQSWPSGGPKLLWQTSGLGQGYSSPIISGNRLFITGDSSDNLLVFALDLEGRKLWQATNGASWKGPYPGSRACCAYSKGRLFHMNAHGRVASFDPQDGRELWSINTVERFGGKVNTWAYSECLLLDADRLFVTPGGEKSLMLALNPSNGEVLWSSAPLRAGPGSGDETTGAADNASYASPLLLQFGDRRLIAGCSLEHVFLVDANNGQILWTRPLRTRYSVIASTPVLVDNALFATAPDTLDARLYKLFLNANRLDSETAWTTRLDTCHGGVIYLPEQQALFGSWYRSRKGWACIEARTGAIRYELNSIAKGSILYADKRLYVLSEDGQMLLLDAVPTAFKVNGQFQLVSKQKGDVWAHPVILHGRLYLRYHDTLFCYDIRR